MRLFYEAWLANDLYDWLAAAALFSIALLAIGFLRSILRHVVIAVSRRTHWALDDVGVELIQATRLWLLFPLALYAGLAVLEVPPGLVRLIDLLAIIGLLSQTALWVNRVIASALKRQIARRSAVDGESVTALAMLGFAARVFVWAMIVLLILDQLGFEITALVAGLGIGGIAIALAVQNVLGDLFASLSIVLDKPFVVGDFIIVGEERGTVEHIGIKTTRVRALSGQLIVFSNNDLLRSRIHNYKRMVQRRAAFTIDVVYQTPPDLLERIPGILREAIEAQPRTRFDRAHLKECGAHSIVFEAVYFVLDASYGVYADVHQAVNLHIIREFARSGIEFAYPTQTLIIEQLHPGGEPGIRTAINAAQGTMKSTHERAEAGRAG
jgi:small-conductance mechanosensitive channel